MEPQIGWLYRICRKELVYVASYLIYPGCWALPWWSIRSEVQLYRHWRILRITYISYSGPRVTELYSRSGVCLVIPASRWSMGGSWVITCAKYIYSAILPQDHLRNKTTSEILFWDGPKITKELRQPRVTVNSVMFARDLFGNFCNHL